VPGELAGLPLPPVLLSLLVRRGFTTADAVRRFLSPNLTDLHGFSSLPDITPAAQRIARAIRAREKLMVFGDYDVDGTTATALLVRTFAALGNEPVCYTPHRAREGYGLSEAGIRQAHESGCRLVVTVDCGTTDFAEIDLARSLGLDVVVTDHHEVKDALPSALAVVNPKRHDSGYPFRELCGCGVAFKLAQAVGAELGSPPETVHEHLDLVALATIADVVPLSGENRTLARIGLTQLRRSRKTGLQELLRIAGLSGKELGGYEVGFQLGPRINAAGRMADASQTVRLLLTDDRSEARALAEALDAANRERQVIEEDTVNQAVRRAERELRADARVLVLAEEGWHEGVIGIAASKVAERFFRPTILISLDADQGKGSGRSIAGFHLHDALQACAADLLAFGGHRQAAGLTIRRDRIPEFERHINAYAEPVLTPDRLQRRVTIDARIALAEIGPELIAGIRQFEPLGADNPRPVFASFGLEVVGVPRQVGADHLKFTVREDRRAFLPAIAFGRAADLVRLRVGEAGHLDLAFQLAERSYAGKTSLQLQVKDMRLHEPK
jgi:single-stranded-DNA-specific exonuclease